MSVLVNKNYKTYDYISRYSPFPYYYNKVDNKYIYGVSSYLVDTTPYKIHIVSSKDTLDNLALQYYNNPTYYWIIASFNRILDPLEPLKVGTQLKIPTMSNISFDTTGRY